MKVHEIMHEFPVCCTQWDTALEAARTMKENDIRRSAGGGKEWSRTAGGHRHGSRPLPRCCIQERFAHASQCRKLYDHPRYQLPP